MEKSTLRCALLNALALLCMAETASASPPGADPRLLSLVPSGAAIVAGLTQGREASYLVLTPNNQADLTDLQSITGVDPTRMVEHTILVAARGSQGLISEHSLLSIGHFDTRHIFKAAMENGASNAGYLGIPVLIVPPLDRAKGISRDLRWLAVIDSQIAVFGTVPMVQEELSRYLTRSPADASFIGKLSHLHSADQSWCVLTPTIFNREIFRRTLAALDPGLGRQDHADDGLILGIHFGRRVEIEYESIPDSSNSESQSETQAGFSPPPAERPRTASYFTSNKGATFPRVISLSKKQYDEFIAQEQAREQTRVEQRSGQPTRK
jgi:hypothetical protein